MSFLSGSISTVEQMIATMPATHSINKIGAEHTFYDTVPKARMENLRYRQLLLRAAADDSRFQQGLLEACSRDVLFWVNAFAYTFDPRKGSTSTTQPFITYDFQDTGLMLLHDAIRDGSDVLFEKSRDMGASWMACLIFLYCWLFREGNAFLMVSRVEDLVDKKDDPDCLFWKVDFARDHLPAWMVPLYSRAKLAMTNRENGSSITGASTTSDSGRGGRKTAILLDEFAAVENSYEMLKATRDTTNCRLFNSTPKGTGTAFYDLSMKAAMPGSKIKKLRMHWSEHPEKSIDMYELEHRPAIGGTLRSPWYDLQCDRAANPMEIAQELDIDYFGSDFQFFEPLVVDQLLAKTKGEFCRGELDFDRTDLMPDDFVMRDAGKLLLWMSLNSNGTPSRQFKYAIGADIATGSGATPSVLSIGNIQTGEKIAAYVDANVSPQDFADITVAIARWFKGPDGHPAYLIFEANGPGQLYAQRIRQTGFRHVYFRQDEMSLTKTITTKLGWYSTKESKSVLLGEYRKALRDKTFINYSHEALSECRHYVYSSNGEILHARAAESIDPSGARMNHADRVIADALLNKAMSEVPILTEEESQTPPEGSFAHRNMMADKERHRIAGGGWSDRWY